MVMGALILPPMLRLDILSGLRLEHVRSTAVVIYLRGRSSDQRKREKAVQR